MSEENADSFAPKSALAYASPPAGTQTTWPLIAAHAYTILSICVLVGMGIVAVHHANSEWTITYVGAARAFLEGKDFYLIEYHLQYTYPPFSAMLMTPFAHLPDWLGRLIWFPIIALSMIYLIKTSWRLAGGKPIEPISSPSAAGPRDQIAFLIGHVIALQLTLNAVQHMQTDTVIAALITAGCVSIVAGRYFRAATWIGLAAAFKATPLLFAPYLIWKRKYVAAGWLMAVAIGVNLLPNLVHSPPGGGIWLVRWSHQYLAPMARSSAVPGEWQNLLVNNQALAGAANRWLKTTWHTASNGDLADRAQHAGPQVIRGFFIGCCLAVTLPVTWVFWRQRKARLIPDVFDQLVPNPVVLECGMVMLLMLLLSPNSSRAHFCVMYLAAFCVARVAVRPDSSMLVRVLLGAAAVCSTLSIHVRLPGSKDSEQILLWIGMVMFTTIFLLAASVVASLKKAAKHN